MRKLVTLRTVSKLSPIEGADVIEVATVDGWECVVKKGEFQEGDWGIYFEIDSMIPHKDWCDHLFKNQKDIDRGFLRIKSIRLRGQLSQGLMLPLPLLLDTDLFYWEALQFVITLVYGIFIWPLIFTKLKL